MRKPGVAPLIDSRSKLSATKLRCGRHRVSLSRFLSLPHHLGRRGRSTERTPGPVSHASRDRALSTRLAVSSFPLAPDAKTAIRMPRYPLKLQGLAAGHGGVIPQCRGTDAGESPRYFRTWCGGRRLPPSFASAGRRRFPWPPLRARSPFRKGRLGAPSRAGWREPERQPKPEPERGAEP